MVAHGTTPSHGVGRHPWEDVPSFEQLLREHLRKAPWLLISLAGHAVILLFVALVVQLRATDHEPPEVAIRAAAPRPEETLPEPPVEDVVERDVEPETEQREVLEEDDTNESEDDLMTAEEQGEDGQSASFEGGNFDFEGQGLGGARGGKRGGRFGGARKQALRAWGGQGTEAPVAAGLAWLAAHQDEDGKWSADEFDAHCPSGDRCDGPGGSLHDAGVTGLALLAFLGDGHHPNRRTRHQRLVITGVRWLLDAQEEGGPEDGRIGARAGSDFVYDHALASLALCEAFLLSRQEQLRIPAQRAVNYILRARNPYHAWRYEVPPNGENDSSVTGWMVFVLKTAEDAGLDVDRAAYAGARTLFDELTDPATGRCGYLARGERPARPRGLEERFPAEQSESLTAVALLCRIFLGERPDTQPLLREHANLLLAKLPRWSEDGTTNDLYYWYYGTYAMLQLGGKDWKRWNEAMKSALVPAQHRERGAHRFGSWDPNDPWGLEGGRVYATAVATLCLEVYYRYAQLPPLGGS